MQLWYDRQGQPIDSTTANRLLGDMAYTRVALTEITSTSDSEVNYQVSTVWLGVNHNWADDGAPSLFETMVFGGGEAQDQTMWRWRTEGEARAGHAEIVASVAATVPDEQIQDTAEATGESTTAAPGMHLHQWSEWQDGEATYDSPLFPKRGSWKEPVQTRRCLKCNKTQLRKLR